MTPGEFIAKWQSSKLKESSAATFAELAQSLRKRGHDAQTVAHFVNRLVLCMFAEDAGLLPDSMFTRMLEHARRRPGEFADLARDLFGAMANGGRIGFEAVAWFNGGLFDHDTALPLERDEIDTALKAAALDWSEIDPSILGTLFERGLDPDKRSQLGAHYTDRDKVMRIVDPVIIRPLLAEWETVKADIATEAERSDAAGSAAARTRMRRLADEMLRTFLERLRTFTVLDPACGSGNFLYLACTRSRTSSTGCNWRPRHSAFSAASPRSARKTSGGSKSTPTPQSSPACRSGSAKSSGCDATGSTRRATRS